MVEAAEEIREEAGITAQIEETFIKIPEIMELTDLVLMTGVTIGEEEAIADQTLET